MEMIIVTYKGSKPRWRAGILHVAGVKDYPDGTFSPDQMIKFAGDSDFQIGDAEASEPVAPDSMPLAAAIDKAVEILTPSADDYGVKELAARILSMFEAAEEDTPQPDSSDLEAVIFACKKLAEESPKDESKFAGSKPKTKSLTSMVGFRVTGQLRDEAWGAVTAEAAE